MPGIANSPLYSNFYVKRKYINLFIHHSNTRGGDENTVFVVVESRVVVESHCFKLLLVVNCVS